MSETSVQARVFLPCLHGYFFRVCTGTLSVSARVLFPCLHGYFFRACTGTLSVPARVLLPLMQGRCFPVYTGIFSGLFQTNARSNARCRTVKTDSYAFSAFSIYTRAASC